MEKLLKRLMEHFNWKRVAIIASTDDIWQIAANLVKIELVRHGINVAHFHSFIPGRLHILESRIVRHADLIRKAANRAMSKYSVERQSARAVQGTKHPLFKETVLQMIIYLSKILFSLLYCQIPPNIHLS